MASPNQPTGSNGGGNNGHSTGAPHAEAKPSPGDLTQLVRHVAQDARRPKLLSLELIEGSKPATLAVPAGYELKDITPLIDKFRTAPKQRAGTTELRDLASFIAWTNRHKDDGSVVYAFDDMAQASLTAIIDHDHSGPEVIDDGDCPARFGRHRGVYKFPLSREWQEWNKVSRQPMKTSDFAAFIERRVGDVVAPPLGADGRSLAVRDPEILKLANDLGKKFATPAELVKLAQGIEINVDATAKIQINRDTGEHFVEYSEANGQGVERIKPPNAFLIAIPVVNNGPPVLMGVHLRYRPVSGTVVWTLELHQPERVFETVFAAALDEVFTDTGLQPLRGVAPEKR